MAFQKRHHGIEIADGEQPRCCSCGSGMSLNIMYPNDECVAFWYCLDGCDGELSFSDWLDKYPVSQEVREHFSTVGMPYSEMLEADLLAAGYQKVGGHIWGGGFWGRPEGKKYWTGYKGQSMEYWLPPVEAAT